MCVCVCVCVRNINQKYCEEDSFKNRNLFIIQVYSRTLLIYIFETIINFYLCEHLNVFFFVFCFNLKLLETKEFISKTHGKVNFIGSIVQTIKIGG